MDLITLSLLFGGLVVFLVVFAWAARHWRGN
jgi:hypothetical protein